MNHSIRLVYTINNYVGQRYGDPRNLGVLCFYGEDKIGPLLGRGEGHGTGLFRNGGIYCCIASRFLLSSVSGGIEVAA